MKHDQKLLEDVASQCVYAGCPAVLEARGILELVGHYDYNDEEICGEQYAYRHAKPKQVEQTNTEIKPANLFTIFPNPTNQNLFISYHNVNENALFEIVDMVGKVQKSQMVNNHQGVTEIDMSNVPNGVYIIILKENGSVRLNQRICVIH